MKAIDLLILVGSAALWVASIIFKVSTNFVSSLGAPEWVFWVIIAVYALFWVSFFVAVVTRKAKVLDAKNYARRAK